MPHVNILIGKTAEYILSCLTPTLLWIESITIIFFNSLLHIMMMPIDMYLEFSYHDFSWKIYYELIPIRWM